MGWNIDKDRTLLVSNMGDDSISLIDIKNKKEAGRVQLCPIQDRYGKPRMPIKKPVVGPHSIKCDKKNRYIYSVNCFDDSVSIIDINSGTVIESFFSGSHPNDMVFNNDESYIYVTNGDSDSVSIIDTYSKRMIAQVSVGVMPHGICISPDGEYIFVANMDSNSVSIIDTWSNSQISCIKVGRCPIAALTSHDGRFLYVVCSCMGNDKKGTVAVISTGNYKILKNIEVGMIPVQMGLSKDGHYLYVTNMGSNDIYIIDLNRFEVKNIIKAGNMVRGIVMGEDESVYVSNSEDNCISIIKGGSLEITDNIEVGIEPTSMLYIHTVNP